MIKCLEFILKILKFFGLVLRFFTSLTVKARNTRAFKPRPDDIFIATYPKSGTTWMQNILYQLTSDGKTDFSHINEIAPCFENTDADLEALPSPRILKTHLLYHMLPKNPARCIYITRHCLDVSVSYYHHNQDLMGFRGPFQKFYDAYLRGRVGYGSWFRHLSEWAKHKDKPNILFLRFEDLKDDLEGQIRKIIDFCNLDVKEEAMPGILERCSFQFMKENQDKFDLAKWRAHMLGLNFGNFIRKGEKAQWSKTLDEAQLNQYRKQFDTQLKGLGFDEYRV